ncbi:MAG TPA: GWxTD domain-containing protein, partial [Caldithrix sp.]|nr:GWxTD domain-containing protein [Caldithrix sp.]
MKSLIYIFLLVALFNSLYSQEQKDFNTLKTRFGFDVIQQPYVNFNIIPFYSGCNWIPDLYLAFEIQNDRLQFTKDGDKYRAEYQLSVVIRHDEEALYKENWLESVELDNFDETNSRKKYQYKIFKLKISDDDRNNKLKPGTYECLFQVRDLTSKNMYKSIREFEIPEFTPTDIQISPVNFLRRSNEFDDSLLFNPSAAALLYNQRYAAYANVRLDSIQSIRVNFRLYKNERDDEQLFCQDFLTLYGDSNIVELKYNLQYDSMAPGKYRIRFSGYTGEKELNAEKEFEIFWFDKPIYLYKADLAIRPMRYILNEQEFNRASDLNYTELESWMAAYWAERDPTPNTDYNELKVEYFKRVQRANEKFNLRHKEGWETDRGKIFI